MDKGLTMRQIRQLILLLAILVFGLSAVPVSAETTAAAELAPTTTTDWVAGVADTAQPTNAYDSAAVFADYARDTEPSSASANGERERTGILAYDNAAHFADTAQLTAAPVTGPPTGAIHDYDDNTAPAFFAVFEFTVAPISEAATSSRVAGTLYGDARLTNLEKFLARRNIKIIRDADNFLDTYKGGKAALFRGFKDGGGKDLVPGA